MCRFYGTLKLYNKIVFQSSRPIICQYHSQHVNNHNAARLWRSFFYVPGDRANMVHKMADYHQNVNNVTYGLPDLIVLDCEDAVAANRKIEARNQIMQAIGDGLFAGYRDKLKRTVVVRMNSLESNFGQEDLNTIMKGALDAANVKRGLWLGPDMICLPKVEHIDQLKWVSDFIYQHLKDYSQLLINFVGLIAIIESCKALANLSTICESAKSLKIPLVCLVFGSDDYCVSLGVNRSGDNLELSYPRQYIPIIAKAYDLACIDMVDINFKDMNSLQANCSYGARLGFNGKQTIHPAQLNVVNKAFSPSFEEISRSKRLLTEVEKHTGGGHVTDAGSFNFEGHMIDCPTIKQAVSVANVAKLMELKDDSY